MIPKIKYFNLIFIQKRKGDLIVVIFYSTYLLNYKSQKCVMWPFKYLLTIFNSLYIKGKCPQIKCFWHSLTLVKIISKASLAHVLINLGWYYTYTDVNVNINVKLQNTINKTLLIKLQLSCEQQTIHKNEVSKLLFYLGYCHCSFIFVWISFTRYFSKVCWVLSQSSQHHQLNVQCCLHQLFILLYTRHVHSKS